MTRLRTTIALSLVGLLSMSCSDPQDMSCDDQDDCYAGEVCFRGVCVPDDDDDETGSNNRPDQDVDSGGSTSDSGDSNSDVGGSLPDADVGGSDTGTNPGHDAGSQQCSFANSGQHSCHSGHEDLQSTSFLTLLPEAMQGAGCYDSTDPTRNFNHFDEETWLIQGCPGRLHKFRYPLWRCVNQTYPAFLRIEPVEPVCSLDLYASLELEEPFASYWEKCVDAGRDYNCYFEAPLDNGGFEWVFKPDNPASSSSYAWTVYLHVQFEPDAYLEYKVTTWIPAYQ